MRLVLDIGIFAATVLMMLTIGMELEVPDFHRLAIRRVQVAWIVVAQAVLVPATALGLVSVVALPADVRAGMLLLAACPVGDMVNIWTRVAEANLPLAVTVNVVSCLASMLSALAAFSLYEAVLGQAYMFAVPPATLLVRMLVLVVVPISSGMIVKRSRPAFVARNSVRLWRLSLVCVCALIIYVFSTQFERLTAQWYVVAAAGTLFMTAAALVGSLLACGMGLDRKDVVTVALLFLVRNAGVASTIAVTVLGHVEYATFAAVYFLTEAPVALGVIGISRRFAPTHPAR